MGNISDSLQSSWQTWQTSPIFSALNCRYGISSVFWLWSFTETSTPERTSKASEIIRNLAYWTEWNAISPLRGCVFFIFTSKPGTRFARAWSTVHFILSRSVAAARSMHYQHSRCHWDPWDSTVAERCRLYGSPLPPLSWRVKYLTLVLFQLIPSSRFLYRITRTDHGSHRLIVIEIHFRTKLFGSAFCRAGKNWNSLSAHVFSPHYDPRSFKLDVKKYLTKSP